MAIMVRKLGASMPLLVWNKKACCNKIDIRGLMGKTIISVAQKNKTRLILFTIFPFSYRFCYQSCEYLL